MEHDAVQVGVFSRRRGPRLHSHRTCRRRRFRPKVVDGSLGLPPGLAPVCLDHAHYHRRHARHASPPRGVDAKLADESLAQPTNRNPRGRGGDRRRQLCSRWTVDRLPARQRRRSRWRTLGTVADKHVAPPRMDVFSLQYVGLFVAPIHGTRAPEHSVSRIPSAIEHRGLLDHIPRLQWTHLDPAVRLLCPVR